MEERYKVTYKEKEVGDALVTREGLYYKVSCVCQRKDNNLYALYAMVDSGLVRLGILVPEGNTFCLTKKISWKSFPEKINRMFLLGKEDAKNTACIPLISGEPISGLQNILSMKLKVTDGGAELVNEENVTQL